jgi:pSer/pThr/pTyr-binding forkhead associated (FHA) protein
MTDEQSAPGVEPSRDAARLPDTTIAFPGVELPGVELPPVGLTAEEVAAIHALPPTSALLVMQRGPSAGARFLLDAERTTAGRSTQSDIFLDDVTVSRKHAEFVREGQQFWVRDVGSLNGTYVNRSRIDQAALRAGDEVQIGKFRMTFHPSPHREDAPA